MTQKRRIPSAKKRREILTAMAVTMIAKFAKKFGVKNIVITIRPLKGFAATTGDWLKFRFVSVDIEKLVRDGHPPYMLRGIIFHEFGHITDKTARKSKVQSEFIAESWGLEQFKKYFPEDAKKYIKQMRFVMQRKLLIKAKRGLAYHQAFLKIKDYND